RPHGLHPFQPGQARSRGAPGRLAVFVISSVRDQRAISCRPEGWWRRTATDGRTALSRSGGNEPRGMTGSPPGERTLAIGGGGMRSAFPPYACYDRLVRRIGEQRRQALGAATAGPQRVDGRYEAGHKRRK